MFLKSNIKAINKKKCLQFALTLKENYIDKNFEKILSKSFLFFLYQNSKIAVAYSFTRYKSLPSFFLMYTMQVRENLYSRIYFIRHQHNFMPELMKHKWTITVKLINREHKIMTTVKLINKGHERTKVIFNFAKS